MIQARRLRSLRSLWLPLAILPIVLYGCVPVYYTYWAPTAGGGRLFNSAAGSIAPGDSIEFSFDSLRIQISGNGTEVGMSLHISKGQSVSFISDEAELHLPEPTMIKFEVSSVDAATLKRLHFRPTDVLTRDLYVAAIKLGNHEKAQYKIKLPLIKVNGKVQEIPEIAFVRKKGFGLFGLGP